MQPTESRSIAHILASAWQRQRNARTGRFFWGALAFWLLAPIGLYAWAEMHIAVPAAAAAFPAAARQFLAAEHHAALLSGMSAGSFLALIGWFALVTDLRAQNHPTLARLVPGHVARLRTALLVAWALGILVAAAVPGALLDAPLEWAFGAAALLPLVALAQRWPPMWVPVFAVPFALLPALFAGGDHAGLRGALAAVWRHDAWLVTAIAMTAGALGMVTVLRDDGTGPRALYEAGLAFGRRFARPRGAGCAPAFATRSRPYAWWLGRSLARPDSPVARRLLLGFGPAAHWTTRVHDGIVFIVFASILGGAMVGLGVFFGVDGRGALPWLSFSLLTGACTPALQAATRLSRTRREQALLVLLPGVPRGPRLNRWLAWQMSGLFLASALVGLVLAGVLGAASAAAATGRTPDAPLGMIAAAATALLPQVAWQWRDWARLRAPSGSEAFPALAPFLLAGAAWALHDRAGVGYLALGIAFALAAALCCAWRWWRMAGEATALPVGRLA